MNRGENSGLELLGKEATRKWEQEIDEINNSDIEIPEEYDRQMRDFIHKLDQKLAEKKKKQSRQRILRTAAVFTVAFITLNAAALGTSEAYREKVFSLIYNDEQGGVTFHYDVESELLEGWEDYWIPTWLPGEFELVEAEKMGSGTLIMYQSKDSKQQIVFYEYPVEATTSFDTEHLSMEEVNIGLNTGYYFEDKEQNMCYLFWAADYKLIVCEYRNSGYDKNIMVKIAENMKRID